MSSSAQAARRVEARLEAQLVTLRAGLSEAHRCRTESVALLDALSARLESLQQFVSPLQATTDTLTTAQKNIDLTIDFFVSSLEAWRVSMGLPTMDLVCHSAGAYYGTPPVCSFHTCTHAQTERKTHRCAHAHTRYAPCHAVP